MLAFQPHQSDPVPRITGFPAVDLFVVVPPVSVPMHPSSVTDRQFVVHITATGWLWIVSLPAPLEVFWRSRLAHFLLPVPLAWMPSSGPVIPVGCPVLLFLLSLRQSWQLGQQFVLVRTKCVPQIASASPYWSRLGCVLQFLQPVRIRGLSPTGLFYLVLPLAVGLAIWPVDWWIAPVL